MGPPDERRKPCMLQLMHKYDADNSIPKSVAITTRECWKLRENAHIFR